MKKFICFVTILSTIMLFGCSSKPNSVSETSVQSTPETLLSDSSSDDTSKDIPSEISLESTNKDTNSKIESSKPIEQKKSSTNSNKTNSKSENKPATNNNPSEKELMNLVINGENALRSIFKGSAYHSKNIIIKDDFYYGEVTDFSSKDDMKKVLSPYFTDSTINTIFEKYLIEKDGKLYFTIGDGGLRVDYNTCKKEFSYNSNKITIKLIDNSHADDVITEIRTLELINGKWLFTDFWYV
ncbi:DL-endopeptidase inhibitor IseA family protein [Clostridium frigidicarnis]|uniref:IseA DL-endopeptidase inhibitor n=1 Tax=Clostridium frigidicarnis TaxID=84698 RepID=A0A1I0X8C2_9CLOT|nr:DL-endopeptidase inhibitor IseA family protein [Clostridium frigidicarnis]SFA96937.1 IseA DL-endopeptidase inhibitor [Clostridium frigidicarnis]